MIPLVPSTYPAIIGLKCEIKKFNYKIHFNQIKNFSKTKSMFSKFERQLNEKSQQAILIKSESHVTNIILVYKREYLTAHIFQI